MDNPGVPRTWRETFTFSGTGGEYFGIWIVNILLTVLTLGIYSAWAKVRRMHFFYRNTRLAGAGLIITAIQSPSSRDASSQQ